MLDRLPSEVLLDDVAPRIPIKYLIRCTSVCKSWYSLITSPSFIAAHTNNGKTANARINKNTSELLLVRHGSLGDNPTREQYSILYDNDTFDVYARLDFPIQRQNEYFRIVGVCNGVVCLTDHYNNDHQSAKIIFWNPSIRKYLILPKPQIAYHKSLLLRDSIGFGFDSTTNDYKVVRIVYTRLGSDPYGTTEVEVYTLNTGLWQNTGPRGALSMISRLGRQAYINDAVHWVAYSRHEIQVCRACLILVFNMRDEMFGEIQLPEVVSFPNTRSQLDVLISGKSLCVINSIPPGYCEKFHIWVMKEYGVTDSWTKQYTIDPQDYMYRALGFNKNGHVILAKKDGYLVSYDPNSLETTYLGIYASHSTYLFYVQTYRESLVLVGGVNGVLGTENEFNDTVALYQEEDRTKGKGKLEGKEIKKMNWRHKLSIWIAGLFLGWRQKKR